MAVEKLLRMSRVKPRKALSDEMDSVAHDRKMNGDRRAFDILMEAQFYWSQMDQYRRDRDRNKRYCYGRQWDDLVTVDGETMSEEQYIQKQGNVPLKNNLIRRLVRNVLGVYRNQNKEPTCKARDRDEQQISETMSTVLQCNMQVNRMNELYARTMEEFLIGGFVVHRKWYGWRNGKEDCWTDYVSPNNFFVDNNMRDFRGWDVSMLGEVHDVSFGQLCEQFATSPKDYQRLRDIYKYAARKDVIAAAASEFGYSKFENYDFLHSSEPGRCRVIEVWRKEQKPRYRCHDYQTGEIYKIDEQDYVSLVERVNDERRAMGLRAGMPEDDIPFIRAEWFIDNYWQFYYLSPFGDILYEGESPYDHGSHPFVFKAYPFIDGEIHSFVSDFIDQQRYTNRLITLYDWMIRSTAKGVLLVPRDCIPDDMSPEEFADRWTDVNGVIVFEPSKSGHMPSQVSANATNIGIADLLNMQLKFFEDISGVNGALQGKPGYSGTSAALYSQQTQNATTSLLDILDTYNSFVRDAAYKDVKNIQQFYTQARTLSIAGKNAYVHYDPKKIRDIEFDLSIADSTSTPIYRMLANDLLMQLYQSQAITVEMLLEHGDFPFADKLLQSLRSQREAMQQGQQPNGLPQEALQAVQQQANPQAQPMLQHMMQ